jgi:hypothetical protein
MEFKLLSKRRRRYLKSSHIFEVDFSAEESQTISAAYAERIHELSCMGNSSQIKDFDSLVASWNTGKDNVIYLSTVAPINAVLTNFSDRTAEVIAELPDITGVPAYRNKDIAIRYKLGDRAIRIAQELANHQATYEPKIDLEQIVETYER